MSITDPLEAFWLASAALEELSPEKFFSEEEFARVGMLVVALRRLQLCIPNRRLKATERERYVERVLGYKPTPDLLEFLEDSVRGARLPAESILALEKRQNGRCALCGALLIRRVSPHVDHIRPVARGGSSELENLQLLCETCNLGKADHFHWVTGNPFFYPDDDAHRLSAKLRYMVLARFRGRCGLNDCENNSLIMEMKISPYTSIGEGGRMVFDNLRVLCSEHYQGEQSRQITRAHRALHRRSSKFSFRQ